MNADSINGRLRHFFLSGGAATARTLGEAWGTQDIRKRISELRAQGWDIQSIVVHKDGSKKYWLNPKQNETLRKQYGYKPNGGGMKDGKASK